MPALVETLQENTEAAVDFVSDRIYSSYPDYLARFGEKGRRNCREDIASHLSFLGGGVVAGSSAPFVEYCRWLGAVLAARHVPRESLLDSLKWLAEYFEKILDPAEFSVIRSIIEDAAAALQLPLAENLQPAFMNAMPPPHPAFAPLAVHLASGNLREVNGVVAGAYGEGAGYLEIAVNLFQPSMYQIGQLWQKNSISVAQEHMATAIAQNQIALAYAAAPAAPSNGRSALFACVEGNQHGLGLRMVSDAFDLAGWDTQYLGPNLPLRDLLSQINACRPEIVGLSASLALHIDMLRRSIDAIRAEFGGAAPLIMVGGLASNQGVELCRTLRADHWASSARIAVEQALR